MDYDRSGTSRPRDIIESKKVREKNNGRTEGSASVQVVRQCADRVCRDRILILTPLIGKALWKSKRNDSILASVAHIV